MSRYRFVQEEKAAYAVARLCRVAGVARSAYHAGARREVSARAQSDALLTEQIVAARASRPHCAPRVSAPPGGTSRA